MKVKPEGAPIASNGTTAKCWQARFKHHTRAAWTRSARRSAIVGGAGCKPGTIGVPALSSRPKIGRRGDMVATKKAEPNSVASIFSV